MFSPQIRLSAEIITLIQNISRHQGELSELENRAIDLLPSLYQVADAEAVHYSTKLEGNLMTLKQVTLALTQGVRTKKSRNRDLIEVLNYSRARKWIKNLAFSQNAILDHKTILKIHDLLLEDIVEKGIRGKYRQQQNVIREGHSKKIVYMPPQYGDVRPLMTEMLREIQNKKNLNTSVLLLAPLFHYWFVTIHPFMDGNGRTARLITNFIMHLGGFTVSNFSALEKQHETNRAEYYRELRKHQGSNFYDIPESIDISSWVKYWLSCVILAYEDAIDRLHSGESKTEKPVITMSHKLTLMIEKVKSMNDFSAAEFALIFAIERTQATKYLKQLMAKKKIKRIGKGRFTRYVPVK